MKRLLSFLLVLTTVLLCVPTEGLPTAEAAEEDTVTYYTEGDWTYYVEDGGAVIGAGSGTAYSGSETAVSTPTTLGGYPVVGIGEYAFFKSELTALTISEGVTFIDSYAVQSCSSLTEITIPSTLTTIFFKAIRACTGLTALHIPSIEVWCAINFTSYTASPFYNNSSDLLLYINGEKITDLVIPEGITSIGANAFYGAKQFTSVTLPKGLIAVGENALCCPNLTAVYTPGLADWCAIEFDGSDANPIYANSSTCSLYVGDKIFTETVSDLILPEGITSVGSYAFYGFKNITSVTLPSTLTVIGDGAFSTCTGITSVTFNGGNISVKGTAFSNCSAIERVCAPSVSDWLSISFEKSKGNPTYYAENLYINGQLLTEVVIPSELSAIGNYAFYKCRSLASVTLHEGIRSIGKYAFYMCDDISELTIFSGDLHIGSRAFNYCDIEKVYAPSWEEWLRIELDSYAIVAEYKSCKLYLNGESASEVVFPEGTTRINDYVLCGFENIVSISMPDSVTEIGNSAFRQTSVTELDIPDGVTKIGSFAFEGTPIQKIDMPDSLVSIGSYAFQNVHYLKEIEIPATVTTIDYGAFGTSKLETVYITDLDAWLNIDFDGLWSNPLDDTALTERSTKLVLNGETVTHVTVPEGTQKIKPYAFAEYDLLTSVSLPQGLTQICPYAFSGTGLTSLSIPDSVTYIGENAFADIDTLSSLYIPASYSIGNAFSNCDELQTVTIADGCVRIGEDAFANSPKLEKVIIPPSVTSVSSNAFKNCPLMTIYGESGSYAETYAHKYCIPFMDINSCETHTYENSCNQCTVCGYVDDSVFSYTVTNNTATITSGSASTAAYTGSYYNIVVPDYIDGYPVTAIGDYAFFAKVGIKSVTLPASVTSVGQRAFYKCYNLTNFSLPSKVTGVGDYAFYNCIRLESIELPNSLTAIGKYAFAGDTVLGNTYISKYVTSIGTNAFADCPALIIYGQAGTTIHTYAVENGIPFVSNGCAVHSYTEATCQAPKTCIYCGITLGSKTGHKYTDATCQTPKTCVYCGTTDGTVIDHKYADATCTEPYTCTMCGDTFGSAKGHRWYAATCIAPQTCKTCGLTEGEPTGIHSWKEATCTAPKTCYICKLTEGEALGHLYFNEESLNRTNCCTRCNTIDESIFSYTISDGKATITGYGMGAEFSDEHHYVTVPATLGGYPVTAIDDYAFSGDIHYLFSVSLPEGLLSIGDRAFCDCYMLVQINLPDSITHIGKEAFYNVPFVETLTLPRSLVSLGEGAFGNCYITELIIPGTVKTVPFEAFCGSSVKTVWIEDGVTALEGESFADCYALTNVYIPASVTSILYYPFRNAADNLTIYGYRGSAAEAYATENNIPFVALTQGDTDGDDTLTPSDAVYLLYHTMLPEEYPAGVQTLDINKDGTVDSKDAVCLLYHVLLPDLYPLEF